MPVRPLLQQVFSRLIEPLVLFPALAALVLAVIWSTTLHLVAVERAAAHAAAVASSRELAETYEAHVVRALREIDQTLKVVKFAYEGPHGLSALSMLRERELLPPNLLFRISLHEADGRLLASTRAEANPADVAGLPLFVEQRNSDRFAVGRPDRGAEGEWQLMFSRRLSAADGGFAGIVVLAVDAGYFVSAYEPQKLGSRGTLALLGDDGVFRARRVADVVSAGERTDYAALLAPLDATDTASSVAINDWDGVLRYTSVRPLFQYPLAVVVGLAADEQLAATEASVRGYLLSAAVASVLLIGVLAVLGRLSWRLAMSKRRESAARVAMARQAGMAEIATNVLHNVGNVLNSVNVSTGIVTETIRSSKVDGLRRAVQMIQAHAGDLGAFMTTDDKGRLLPGYLEKVADALTAEQRASLNELELLARSVDHIKEIVATQQSLAGAVSVTEPLQVEQVIAEALRVQATALERHAIAVDTAIEPLPPLLLDRHRLLSILINLIANAKDAIVARDLPTGTGRIMIEAGLTAAGRLRIRIADNGEGIAPDLLTRIFAHGYSSRSGGRGFGLHSCALAAADFGGTLTPHSAGIGQGAAFTLELPLASQ